MRKSSLAWMSGGTGKYGIPYLNLFGRMLGSQYSYGSLAQEHTGRYWAHGLTLGSQGLSFEPDYENTEMLLIIGKNPYMSHHMSQARRVLTNISKDPDRLLVVVDPRLSETARMADIHLAPRIGTDALLIKSMISIILKEEMHDQEYVHEHVDGFSEIRPLYADFDVESALAVCELEYDRVLQLCREFTTRQSCLADDLGVLMNRHSSLVSYLLVVLQAICGRIGVSGGNYLTGASVYSDPDDPNTWRTLATGIPAIQELYPPNVIQEEILSSHPERLRALFTMSCNPLRSYADTTAFEEAFDKLDLLVVTEVAMSETAALAHYVLPAKSGYESWDGRDAVGTFPDVYLSMREPVVEPEAELKENGEIFTLLADAMGLIPDIPAALYEAAETGDFNQFRDALVDYIEKNPEHGEAQEFIVAKTLSKALGSTHLAALFSLLQNRSQTSQEEAERVGFARGPDQGLEIFKAVLDCPTEVKVGVHDKDNNIGMVDTANGRIKLNVQEVVDWLEEVQPADEEEKLQLDDRFPLILMAGRHMDMNANSKMRVPAWNEGRRPCTLAMNPSDAEEMGFADSQIARVITEAGEETLEVEVTDATRKGQVIIPHGFGLVYDGVKHGANINRLTKNTNRDRIAATPLHRYVPCRVEAV